MSNVRVEYIGDKPTKEDNVANTGMVWLGNGDVQAVPIEAWAKMARHTGVWRLADQVETEAPKRQLGEVLVKGGEPSTGEPGVDGSVGDSKPADLSAVSNLTPVGDALFGTDHPAAIDIGGTTVLLGKIIADAHAGTGLTVQAWNLLGDADRQDFVNAHIEALRTADQLAKAKAAAAEAKATKAAAKPKGEAKAEPKPRGKPGPKAKAKA